MVGVWLSKHAHYCIVNGQGVFLDLRRDQYLALDAGETALLAPILERHPAYDGSIPFECSADLRRVIAELTRAGLLTHDRYTGKRAQAVSSVIANCSLITQRLGDTQWPGYARHFAWAHHRASFALRHRSIESIVQEHRRRKRRGRRTAPSPSRARLAKLIGIYRELQPHAFSERDACLRNSLTLSYFLASFRIFPSWWFGVQLEPWAAHCWLQEGAMVLNDTVEHVRRYVPIMRV